MTQERPNPLLALMRENGLTPDQSAAPPAPTPPALPAIPTPSSFTVSWPETGPNIALTARRAGQGYEVIAIDEAATVNAASAEEIYQRLQVEGLTGVRAIWPPIAIDEAASVTEASFQELMGWATPPSPPPSVEDYRTPNALRITPRDIANAMPRPPEVVARMRDGLHAPMQPEDLMPRHSVRIETTTNMGTIEQRTRVINSIVGPTVFTSVTDLQDEGIRRALVDLGWTPPGECLMCMDHMPMLERVRYALAFSDTASGERFRVEAELGAILDRVARAR